MAKSRIKSEEEYNKILGVTPINSEEKPKTTHDASQYFDELKDSKKEQNDDSNPFDRVISVEQIKENLKHSGSNNVENIKAQIASAQKEVLVEDEDVADDADSYVRTTKHSSDGKKEFSFEENARKLYENLRGSNLNMQTNPKRTADEEPKKTNEIDVVEPISISKERVTSPEPIVETPVATNTIPETSSLEANFESLKGEAESADCLELTADFTLENENFIDAINQRKKDRAKLPVEPNFEPQSTIAPEPIIENPVTAEPVADDNMDLVKQLDEQMGILEETSKMDDIVQPISEMSSQPQIEPISPVPPVVDEQVAGGGIAEELDMLTKSKPKEDLSSTLTLALDPENSISFSPDDMKTLKNEELLTDKEKPKSRIGDIIVTVALIIMICIVVFLLVKMFILDK